MEDLLLAAVWIFIIVAVIAEVRRLRRENGGQQYRAIEPQNDFFNKIEEYRRDID